MRFTPEIFFTVFFATAVAAAPITETQVFDWWDDGIISPEEAQEILDQLQEGNLRDACLLAEVYALENCNDENSDIENTNANSQATISAPKFGYVSWKTRWDSLGQVERNFAELKVNFYRFTLKLGNQELLTYKRDGAEAHFGDISTREFHSAFPLDTLWGSVFIYPLGNLKMGGALDTAGNIHGQLSYSIDNLNNLQAAYWHKNSHALSLQLESDWFQGGIWWQQGQGLPFVKLQVQKSHGTTAKDKDRLIKKVGWKTVVYFHGDSIPDQIHLTNILQKHKFWGTQNVSATFADSWHSKISANARIMIPLDVDTANAKFKVDIESGPKILRGTASGICLDAANGCEQSDWKLKVQSGMAQLTTSASVKSRFTSDHGFDVPRIEAGATYNLAPQNFIRLAIAFPKANPQRQTQVRSQISFDALDRHLQCSLTASYRWGSTLNFHPTHGYLQIKALF